MHYPRAIYSSLLICLISPYAQAASLPQIPSRHCGTEEPSTALRYAHSFLSWAEPLENDLQNASTVQSRLAGNGNGKTKRGGPVNLFTIDTYIHIIADSASASPASSNYVSGFQIRKQFEYLQRSFNGASIGFRLRGYTRTINDTWASNGDDSAMKTALRRGGYSTLNIYYQSRLQSAPGTPGIPAGSILLGFCSLPGAGVSKNTPAAVYVRDGCNILSSTLPGGSTTGYNQGGSTVHEVGHWNGLLHTFQGNSCDTDDYGDYVADTPQEATSTSGCPTGKDSCPNSGVAPGFDGSDGSVTPYGAQGYSGPDPIKNFMDYSTDACYSEFTPGQGARMLNIWQIYRAGR